MVAIEKRQVGIAQKMVEMLEIEGCNKLNQHHGFCRHQMHVKFTKCGSEAFETFSYSLLLWVTLVLEQSISSLSLLGVVSLNLSS